MQRPDLLFQASEKSHLLLWDFFFSPLFLIQRGLTSFMTRDVTNSEKMVLREFLFEVVQFKDELHSQYCSPGSETVSTFFSFPQPTPGKGTVCQVM